MNHDDPRFFPYINFLLNDSNDVAGLAQCGAKGQYFVCTRLAAHPGAHMALTLAGGTREIWQNLPTALEQVRQKLVAAPTLFISNGQLCVPGGES